MSALFGDAVRAAQANDITAREQLNLLADLISRFPNIADSLLQLRQQISALELLLLNEQNASNSPLCNEVAGKLATSIDADTAAILSAFSGTNYRSGTRAGTPCSAIFCAIGRTRTNRLALFSIMAGASFGGP